MQLSRRCMREQLFLHKGDGGGGIRIHLGLMKYDHAWPPGVGDGVWEAWVYRFKELVNEAHRVSKNAFEDVSLIWHNEDNARGTHNIV